jgi:hypothetical protein
MADNRCCSVSPALLAAATTPVPPSGSNQDSLADESMRRYQAILRLDTSNPPGNERLVVDYLQSVLDSAGIETRVFAREKEPSEPSGAVARLMAEKTSSDYGPHRRCSGRSDKMEVPSTCGDA